MAPIRKQLNTKHGTQHEQELNEEMNRSQHLCPVFQQRSKKRRRFGFRVIEQPRHETLFTVVKAASMDGHHEQAQEQRGSR